MLDSIMGMLKDAMTTVLAVTHDPRLLSMVLVAGATMATIIGFGMPYLQADGLGKRMKSVAVERAKIRAREREASARGEGVALRSQHRPGGVLAPLGAMAADESHGRG